MKKLFAVLLSSVLVLASCHNDAKMTADAVVDRESIPGLDASAVTTLISDSGITRYRITTQTWQIYDKATPVYWEFPDGIYMEKFNYDLEVDTWLRSDYAHYNEETQIWEQRVLRDTATLLEPKDRAHLLRLGYIHHARDFHHQRHRLRL